MRDITIAALLVGLAAPAVAEPAPLPATMFITMETTDIVRAEAFYTRALGMKRVLRISRPQDPFIKDAYSFSGDPLAAEPLVILVQHNDRKTAPPPSAIVLGVHVADAHAAAAKVRAAGYAVLREPPPEDHGAKLATIAKDPDGNTIELVQLDIARLR
jgi:lactoylglutathione lyase